jgi:release factor glutamine methyltransferase
MHATPDTSHIDIDRVYEPAEDSFLLLDALEQEESFLKSAFKQPISLEIGSGSGIVTTFLSHLLPNALYLASDINLNCCQTTLETNEKNGGAKYLDVLNCSLADGLRISPDIILFNPPYVPSSEETDESLQTALPTDANDSSWLDYALDGGKDGMQVTDILLNQLHDILAPNGVAYILFCARNHPDKVAHRMRSQFNWNVSRVIERKAGWEVLSVWKFQR